MSSKSFLILLVFCPVPTRDGRTIEEEQFIASHECSFKTLGVSRVLKFPSGRRVDMCAVMIWFMGYEPRKMFQDMSSRSSKGFSYNDIST